MCFTDTRRTDKDKRTNRTLGVLQTRTRAPDRIRNGFDSLILTDNAFMQTLFHMKQFLGF